MFSQLPQHNSRRLYRALVITVVTLTLLLGAWLYSDSAIGSFATKHTIGLQREQQSLSKSANLIPPKIWQILLPKKSSTDNRTDPKKLAETPSWLALNPDYA